MCVCVSLHHVACVYLLLDYAELVAKTSHAGGQLSTRQKSLAKRTRVFAHVAKFNLFVLVQVFLFYICTYFSFRLCVVLIATNLMCYTMKLNRKKTKIFRKAQQQQQKQQQDELFKII